MYLHLFSALPQNILIPSITYSHRTLFNNISLSLETGLTALVGNNGVGKSILANILAKNIKPTSGLVQTDHSSGFYDQIHNNLQKNNHSIAAFVGIESQLLALKRVESGSCDEADFELIKYAHNLVEDLIAVLNESFEITGIVGYSIREFYSKLKRRHESGDLYGLSK